MRAVVFPRAGAVRLDTLADPVPGPGEAVVRVRASGLCHTDIEVMRGHYGTGAFPLAPGHEFAGEVVAVGPDVSDPAVGARVVVDPNLSCGACRACLRGRANLCAQLGAYGVTRHGGFADLVTVAARNLVPLGDMPFARAALAEPVGCVLTGVAAIAPDPRDAAVIVGAGPIGLLFALVLRSRGLTDIVLSDIDADRLALAASFGFATGAPDARAYDIAIDATGVPAVAAGLPGHLVDGGRALFFGVCPPDARIEVAPFEIFRRQLTLAGTHSLNHNIPEALETIAAIGPQIDRVVSHRVDLAEIAAIM